MSDPCVVFDHSSYSCHLTCETNGSTNTIIISGLYEMGAMWFAHLFSFRKIRYSSMLVYFASRTCNKLKWTIIDILIGNRRCCCISADSCHFVAVFYSCVTWILLHRYCWIAYEIDDKFLNSFQTSKASQYRSPLKTQSWNTVTMHSVQKTHCLYMPLHWFQRAFPFSLMCRSKVRNSLLSICFLLRRCSKNSMCVYFENSDDNGFETYVLQCATNMRLW